MARIMGITDYYLYCTGLGGILVYSVTKVYINDCNVARIAMYYPHPTIICINSIDILYYGMLY